MKSDSGEPPPNARFTPAIAVVTILLGAVGLFPIGLLALVAGTGFFDLFRDAELDAKHVALIVFAIGSLIAIVAYGLSKTRSPGSIIGGAVIVLVILNLGGCAAMWSDLSGIH